MKKELATVLALEFLLLLPTSTLTIILNCPVEDLLTR